ncbi:MAG: hypothetical protein V4497_01160 [Bacteroidota bacterium]
MESIIEQQQNVSFRAATITDLNTIVNLYQKQESNSSTETSAITNHFGLPLYVAECDNQIVGYSYASATNSDDYCLKIHIDTPFLNYPINDNLMRESELFFKNEWQNDSNRKLSVAIVQLVNWLNNSNS